MPQRKAEQLRLVLRLHLGGGRRNGYTLQADHLSHDAAARICGGHQDRIQSQPVRGDHLEIPEERIRRCVTTGKEHAQPAQQRAEEWEQDPGGGKGQTQRRGGARIVHQKRQAQYADNRQNRQLKLLERSTDKLEKLDG